MSTGAKREIPYGRLAEIYDRIYSWKDYAQESHSIAALVRRWGPRPARTLLDVACGTGAHLRFLSPRYECTGIDASPEMLAVARTHLPRVRFEHGMMPDFDLGTTFDVVTCLFSAIGYVRTEPALRRTLRSFARHLSPDGLVIVEPWLTPEVWKPGAGHLVTVPSREAPIARMSEDRTVRGRSVIDMHYLAAVEGEVRYWVERHDLGLFSNATMRAAFRSAGLYVRRVPSGFYGARHHDRGLFLGRRAPFSG